MMFFAFSLLIFAVAYISLTSKTLMALDSEAHEDARIIADKISSEINAAVSEGPGYSKSFRLPASIRSANYTVSVERGTVFVDWSGKGVISHTVADNVTGSFTYGWNVIENREGVVFVNESSGA